MEYPREYRLTRGWRYVLMSACLLLSAAMLAIPLWLAGDPTVAIGFLWLMCGPMVILGLVGAIALDRTRVILLGDAIELQALTKRKRLDRADIEGRQLEVQQHGPPVIRLISRMGSKNDISLPQFLATDSVLQAWIAAIPDRDTEDSTR
jgi:hypothetical protein